MKSEYMLNMLKSVLVFSALLMVVFLPKAVKSTALDDYCWAQDENYNWLVHLLIVLFVSIVSSLWCNY